MIDRAKLTNALGGLRPRERAVLALVAGGQQNKEIAHALGITEGTVKTHLYHAAENVGGPRVNRAMLTVWYLAVCPIEERDARRSV